MISVGARAVPAGAAPSDCRFEQRAIEVDEGAGRVVVNLRRDTTASLEDTEAAYETVDRTAIAAEDYMGARGRIRLTVGQTAHTITVFLHDDAEPEVGDQSFIVRITDPYDRSRVIDEAVVVIRDDDDAVAAEAIELNSERRSSEAAAAATTAAAARPAASAAPARRVTSPARRPVVTPRERNVRVTPFELRGPDPRAEESLPTPAHMTPLVAAGLVAALALGRVTAELWYRWRVRDI